MKIHDFYGEHPDFRMNGEKLDGYCHIIDEQINNIINNVNENCFDERSFTKRELSKLTNLSSFVPNKILQPKIWINGLINSKVRLRLLDVADDFIKTLNISWVEPEDIILTGSLANFNWSKYSDFDLHILFDFSEVDDRTEFVREYFNSKKNEWNNLHDELKIYGFPVELYVQDINEEHTASGVYSLETNRWLVKPNSNNFLNIKLNKELIRNKAIEIIRRISNYEDKANEKLDDFESRKLGIKVKKLFDKLKGIRKVSLKKYGEYGSGNILYKLLRRNGYLTRLIDLKSKVYDKEKSID